MKNILVLILAVVIAFFILSLAKDVIIKTSVEKGVEVVTGLKLNISSIKVGIITPVIAINALRLMNPANFPDKTMVDMPEIYVRYNLGAMLGGKAYLPELRLVLKEFLVEKNSKGELNLDAFKNVQASKKGTPASKQATGKAPEIKIDSLKLKVGKVIYKDYSKGAQPEVKEFNVNLDETYTNVDNPSTLASLIIAKALMNTTIASLTGFDVRGLENSVNQAMSGAKKAASAAAVQVQEVGKEATQAVEGLLKNPFGSAGQTK